MPKYLERIIFFLIFANELPSAIKCDGTFFKGLNIAAIQNWKYCNMSVWRMFIPDSETWKISNVVGNVQLRSRL